MAQNKRELRKKMQRRREQQTQSKAGQLRIASRWPITSCLVTQGWDEPGEATSLIQILVTRTRTGGALPAAIAAGVFLVDPGCLGVKNTHGGFCSPSQYRSLVSNMSANQLMAEEDPAVAAMIIDQSIAYARKLGFAPHRDFAFTRIMIADIQPSPDVHRLRLGGPDGRPYFIGGPYDDSLRIVRQLETVCGAGNFGYLAPV